jgi:hypothetical protein
MNETELHNETERCRKLARRWAIVLAALLITNLTLVAAALSGARDGSKSVAVEQREPVVEVVENGDQQPDQTGGVADDPPERPALVEHPTTSDTTNAAGSQSASSSNQTPDASVTTGDCPESTGSAAIGVELPALVLINPPASGGVVYYVVDDKVFSLLPGEYQELPGETPRRLVFHKGDDFDDFDRLVGPGACSFAVGSNGWQLVELPALAAERLLSNCRRAELP